MASPRRRSFLWRSQIGIGNSVPEIECRRDTFQQYVREYPFPEEPDEDDCNSNNNKNNNNKTPSLDNNNDNCGDSSAVIHPDLDPLTAMLLQEQTIARQQQEMDIEYRKEVARRKRNKNQQQQRVIEEDEGFDQRLAAVQIIDKDLNRLSHPSGNTNNIDSTARKHILRQVLYLYNCRHETVGYRQGMHEIASWLLWALEQDYLQNDDDDETLTVECFFMTESILTDIQAAFDVGDNHPMKQMSRRIGVMIHSADALLWQRLEGLGVPPAIYLTKWVRLLFSREVIDVMSMWDAMFLAKEDGFSWMMILEAMAAARLLQHRAEIILSPEDGLLNLLMNLPPEQDFEAMLDYLRPLLRGETLVLPTIPMPRATNMNGNEIHEPHNINLNQKGGIFSTQVVGSLATHLSGVKESLAAQTQSLSKRLTQEWENIQAESQIGDRSYDDGVWNQSMFVSVDPYQQVHLQSTSSPVNPSPRQSPQRSSPRSNYPPHTWAYEIEHRLAILHNFVMITERQHRASVDPSVWQALADMEEIRQAIFKTHNR
jgi:hypothetical protein